MSLFKKRLASDDRTLLLRQLSLLCGNGLSVDQAIRRLAGRNESAGVRAYCQTLLEKADRRDDPDGLFDPLLSAVLRQCSESAAPAPTVAQGFSEMAEVHETTDRFDQALKSALVYPVMVFSVFAVVVAVLLIFVIPVFESIFSDFGGSLPGPTRLVLAISRWFGTYAAVVVAGIVGGLLLLKKVPASRLLFIWAVPGLRQVARGVTAIQFSQLFAVLLKLGLPLEAAYKTASQAVSTAAYGMRLARQVGPVTDIAGLKAALKSSGVFTESITGLVDLVEHTEALPKIFGDFSAFLRKGFDARLKKTYKQIEVAAFLMTGFFVGGAVIAMYLPIFRMAGALG
jgi:type IV pilus assembly protein PilC